MKLGEVIIEYPSSNLDRPFYYACKNDNGLKKGVRVIVPFAHKQIIGYILNILSYDKTKEELEKEFGYQIKYIEKILDEEPILSEELIDLAKRVAKYYFSPLITVLQTMLPPSLKINSSMFNKPKIAYESYVIPIIKDTSLLTLKQIVVYQKVINRGQVKKNEISTSIVNTLLKKNYLKEIKVEKNRYQDDEYDEKEFFILNEEQEKAKEAVLKSNNEIFLLQGVTSSGKTEVYLHLTKEYLKQHKQVLILLPEISLTYQVTRLFKQRFKNIAVLHSSLTNSEKYDQYRLIASGKINIVLGARSAIFAPLNNIGLIIIDEEHSETYKQDTPPYYHALTVAKMRQMYQKCNILLGSATPSLESKARALKGNYKLLTLTKRYKTHLPETKVIDLNNAAEIDETSIIFSRTLRTNIQKCLDKKEQVLLLLNRRGYAPYVNCRRCNYVFKCPTCNVPLSYHKAENLLKCHHCGFSSFMVDKCPKCDSQYLHFGGFGLQKAEEELIKLFPHARILRLDSDVAKIRLASKKIIEQFNNLEADILIGSSIISKGLDFKNVTLSCVINADIGLNIPSYRASENVFSLITQSIGRAGRSKEGIALIQTYTPNHYAISLGANQDYETFFKVEMKYRHLSLNPPFSYLALISLSCKKEKDLLDNLMNIKNFLLDQFASKRAEIIGPSEYYVSFLNGRFRRKFLIKFFSYEDIVTPLNNLRDYLANNQKINLAINIDPYEDY